MDVGDLYRVLKKGMEKRGYYFNTDKQQTYEILEGLLTNKQRYGYMACPCRLASGESEHDRDIICPCWYLEADIKEYGSCYCNLYVSTEYNTNKLDKIVVPERRPPEKMV